MKVRHTGTTPLRFYFESEAARNMVCKEIGQIGKDANGPYLQINGEFALALLDELKAGKLRLVIGKETLDFQKLRKKA